MARSYGKSVYFSEKLLECLPKLLQHFAFQPAKSKSYCCSISLSVFGLSVFWILAVQIECNGILFKFVIFLITYDVEHFFTCSFIVSSLLRCLFRFLACFLIWLFSYCWVLRLLYIFWISVLYQTCVWKYFLPVCVLSFYHLKVFLFWHASFNTQQFHKPIWKSFQLK